MVKPSRKIIKPSGKIIKPSGKMATVDPETQALAAAGLSFLSLPPELRNMIYRLLLVSDKILAASKHEREDGLWYDRLSYDSEISELSWASLGEYHIQPAFLRVCWQVYREASSILHCENIFGMKIRGLASDDNKVRTSSFRSSFVADGLSSFWDSSLEKLQRLVIVIEEIEYSGVRSGVDELCRFYLSKSHALQHLSIYIDGLYFSSERVYKALAPFALLRNLRSVDIQGAKPQCAQNLKLLMLGKTPLENIGGMYDMLEDYVEELDGNRSDLKKALKAMWNWDAPKFKEIRSKILSDGQDRIDRVSRHLFDFDLKGNEDHQAADVTVEDTTAIRMDRPGPQAKRTNSSKRLTRSMTKRLTRSMTKSLGIVEKKGLEGSRRKKK